jgi:Zn-dependent peptidase ImmA (M78 family)
MTPAHINPAVLRWAMDRTDVQIEEIAGLFKKTPEKITAWVEGTTAPTFTQAQRLAKRLRIPFGYLFLSTPPRDEELLPDFRRAHAGVRREPSVDLRDVIFDVLRKQDWYRDFRAEREDSPLTFVGRFTLQSDIPEVANDIRTTLSFEEAVRPETQAAQFLRVFVRQVEAAGVLVMRNGVVRQATNRVLDVSEFRGFSIADPMAPAIFVNNADSNAAQVFTLAHELAHIWIGRGGISDADLTLGGDATQDVEEFCNLVAGEILLPWNSLEPRWRARDETVAKWITSTSHEFHVSTVMVARQLWRHDAIDREQFFQFYETERGKWLTKGQEAGSSGGNFYLSAPIRNSRLLTEAVLESVGATETSIRDASRLLGVKPANLPKLEESMGIR